MRFSALGGEVHDLATLYRENRNKKKKTKRKVKTMILKTVSISAAPRELHIKLFKAHGDELEKLEKEIASLDAVALVSWARVFEAVKTPGVVAHWEVQHEIDGKAYTEQRILHASVKNPGCIQYSTAHIYPDEYIPVMDSQFKNASVALSCNTYMTFCRIFLIFLV